MYSFPFLKQLNDMQKAYFYDLLNDLFNFYSLEQAYDLARLFDGRFELHALDAHSPLAGLLRSDQGCGRHCRFVRVY